MCEQIIQDIQEMVSSSLKNKGKIELAAILWSIDCRHRCKPSVDEINYALQRVFVCKVDRTGSSPYIVVAKDGVTDKVTKSDYDLALKRSAAAIVENSKFSMGGRKR